jgi:RES domain-containing protein
MPAFGTGPAGGTRESGLQFDARMPSHSSDHDRDGERRPRAESRAASNERDLSSGIGYRATRPEHTDLGGSVDASRRKPGRFNTQDIGALYLCRDAPTALEEFQTTEDGQDADHCVIVMVRFAVRNLLDFTTPSILAAWGLTCEHLTNDDTSRCQQIARGAIDRGWEGVQWPSATGKGTSLALFLDHLAAGSSVGLLRVIESSSAK